MVIKFAWKSVTGSATIQTEIQSGTYPRFAKQNVRQRGSGPQTFRKWRSKTFFRPAFHRRIHTFEVSHHPGNLSLLADISGVRQIVKAILSYREKSSDLYVRQTRHGTERVEEFLPKNRANSEAAFGKVARRLRNETPTIAIHEVPLPVSTIEYPGTVTARYATHAN